LDFSGDPARQRLAERQGAQGTTPVVSSELLCGHPYQGGRENHDFAYRIKEIAPDAKILITIREQIRAITSSYMQYLNRAGTLSLRDFLNPDEYYGYYYFSPSHFHYDRIVHLYQTLFGAGNVLVITQEEIAKDSPSALRTISEFAGADAAPIAELEPPRRIGDSPPESLSPILRRINHFRSGAVKPEVLVDLGPAAEWAFRGVGWFGRVGPLNAWLKSKQTVREFIKQELSGQFAESNQQLRHLIGPRIDLASFSYELPRDPVW